ncbi:MAG: CRTAC1 family protein [Candidatus Neomarinimicrobiota bacterium]
MKRDKLTFIDVTREAGLGDFRHETGAFGGKLFPESMGSGGGFIDYDNDNWPDILLVGGGEWPSHETKHVPALWLYHNNGDGTFTLKTEEAGLGGISAYGFGVTVADYDNDGDQDFYFTTLSRNMLFRNEKGVFFEVGEISGSSGEPSWGTSAIFFDADRDGWVDLYVGNYVEWSPENDLLCTLDGVNKDYCTPELYIGVPGRYYRSNGDGTFMDETETAGFLPAPGKTLGVTEFDFNRDGWVDLVVANDTQRDLLYVNNGDGTFTEKGALFGVAYDEHGRARAGMGIDAGVVDKSGEETIFVGHFSKEMIGVFRYGAGGLFEERSAISRIGRPSLMRLTFGIFLFDVDLDGDLDLFTANGHVQPDIELTQDGISYSQPPYLFLNKGDGTFEDVASTSGEGFIEPVVGRGAAYADFDRNGKLDIMVTENGGPVHLWRNNSAGNRFLRVRLEGSKSNRDGISSRLVAWVNDQRMERRIRTGSSFLSSSEKTATFGLGEATFVDSLLVYWPSGLVEHFSEVSADQEVQLVEGSGSLVRNPMSVGSTITSQ